MNTEQTVSKIQQSEEIRVGEWFSAPLEAFENPYFIIAFISVVLTVGFTVRFLMKLKFGRKK